MTQIQKERQTSTHTQDVQQDAEIPGGEARERAATVSAETEDILADIDELLSELPQDLATEFRQKGGE